MLTLDEVLGLYGDLRFTKLTLRRAIKAGKLPASKIGKCLYVVRSDVVALFTPHVRGGQEESEEPAARVPNAGGLTPCPTCSAMSTSEHQEICAS